MNKVLIAVAALSGLLLGGVSNGYAVDAAAAQKLAGDKLCTTCHSPDKALLGPAFKAIAKRYKGDASAVEKLAAKVQSGGKGAWSPPDVIMKGAEMPKNDVTAAQAKLLVEWILSM